MSSQDLENGRIREEKGDDHDNRGDHTGMLYTCGYFTVM